MDIALLEIGTSGPVFRRTEPAVTGVNLRKNFVYELNGGTAFVCAVSRSEIKIGTKRVLGLLLTAAHCVINIATRQFTSEKFDVKFNDGGPQPA